MKRFSIFIIKKIRFTALLLLALSLTNCASKTDLYIENISNNIH